MQIKPSVGQSTSQGAKNYRLGPTRAQLAELTGLKTSKRRATAVVGLTSPSPLIEPWSGHGLGEK
jgi:hypothetical protein